MTFSQPHQWFLSLVLMSCITTGSTVASANPLENANLEIDKNTAIDSGNLTPAAPLVAIEPMYTTTAPISDNTNTTAITESTKATEVSAEQANTTQPITHAEATPAEISAMQPAATRLTAPTQPVQTQTTATQQTTPAVALNTPSTQVENQASPIAVTTDAPDQSNKTAAEQPVTEDALQPANTATAITAVALTSEKATSASPAPTNSIASTQMPLEQPMQPTEPLAVQIESLKKQLIKLNRDLFILEEELLFPASTQISVLLAIDADKTFSLDSVKLKIDDQVVTQYLYTKRQVHALQRGGIQRLYMGNLRAGEHEITAIFIGYGPNKREYKRAATLTFSKETGQKTIELKIFASQGSYQPEFSVIES